jgi:hypothetical protein
MSGTATTYILGAGSTLAVSSTSGGTFTPIAQLSKISYSAAKASYADITNLGSPSAAAGAPPMKEVAPSMIDPGTATITGILVPAGDPGQTLITAGFGTQLPLYFKHQFSPAIGQTTGALRTFIAYVSERPTMDSSLTEAVTFNFALQVTGAITDTAGTSGS